MARSLRGCGPPPVWQAVLAEEHSSPTKSTFQSCWRARRLVVELARRGTNPLAARRRARILDHSIPRPTVLGIPLFTALGRKYRVGPFFNGVWIIVSIWRSRVGWWPAFFQRTTGVAASAPSRAACRAAPRPPARVVRNPPCPGCPAACGSADSDRAPCRSP